MLRKENEVVPEANGPVHQQEGFGSGQSALVDPCQKVEEILDRRIDMITRILEQHLTGLEQDARQPRLVMEAERHANTKTRERTEGIATAVQAMHGDSCSADGVDPDPKCSTGFDDDCTGPPTPPCLGENALIRAATPKSCLPSLEMRSPTAAGGLLPTGEASTATKTTFNKSPLRLYPTEETNSKEENSWTSISSAWYDSSFCKLLAASSCRKVIEAKSIQNRMFDPGGFQGRLRACPFLGSWRALLCGRFMLGLTEAAAFFWRIDD